MQIDLDQIRELMRAVKEHDISELELEQDGQRIFLRRGMEPPAVPLAPVASATAPVTVPVAATAAPEDDGDCDFVTSPFVGTFYRAPSPDAEPFVNVGDTVASGQALCIVEAMKLMNEIETELAGEIVEILATNGKPVEYGERLFKIRKG